MNKSAKIKTGMILLFIMLLSVIFIYGDNVDTGDITLTSPDDNSYVLNDTQLFTVNGSAVTGWNISSIDFYNNVSGWSLISTLDARGTASNSALGNITTVSGMSDGIDVLWNFRINYTEDGFTYGINVVNESDAVNLVWYNKTTMDVIHKDINTSNLVIFDCLNYNIVSSSNYTVYNNGSIEILSNITVNDSTAMCVNYTYRNVTSIMLDNRTLSVEYPPPITITAPATGTWSSATTVEINFSVSSAYTTGATFDCRIYSNETGNWSVVKTGLIAVNNTDYLLDYEFGEDIGTLWNIQCFERNDGNIYGYSVSNYTINIDRTKPSVTLTNLNEKTAANGVYISNSRVIAFNFTPTDANMNTCELWYNLTGSSPQLRHTTAALTSGVETNITLTLAADGNYTYFTTCSDSASNKINSTSYWFYVDTAYADLNLISNESVSNYADRWWIFMNGSEDINYTLHYGSSTAPTTIDSSATYSVSHNVTLAPPSINFSENTHYYFNISICDRAGNCNSTIKGQKNFIFPFKLYTGWSYYGIYDNSINFSDILTQSGADYVYYWNESQDWIYATAGGTTNMDFKVGNDYRRHVVALYEGTNSTWRRTLDPTKSVLNESDATYLLWGNDTDMFVDHYPVRVLSSVYRCNDSFIVPSTNYALNSTPGKIKCSSNSTDYSDGTAMCVNYTYYRDSYTINITSGTNFIKMYKPQTFREISVSLLNGSDIYGVNTSVTPTNLSGSEVKGGLVYNMSQFSFSAYNNTLNSWSIDFIYDWTWNNGTQIKNISESEVLWLWSGFNVTWNGTQIIGNWSR